MKIKIIIVDDHPLILKGFQNVLSSLNDIELLAICSSGAELLLMLDVKQPDVLLMDIQIPDIPGDKLAPMVLKLYPGMLILNLTNIDSVIYANSMLRLGVKGYLLKTASEKRLLEAIKTVFNGGIFIDPDMQHKMAQLDQVIKKALSTKPTLTPREKELLQLIVEGYNGPEIASKMFLSVNTVEKYRENLIFKLDVRNTASLVAKALKMGLAY